MKNKFLFILIILSFVSNVLADEEIIFKAGEINILNDGNLVKASNGSEVMLPDNITIAADKFEYNKLNSNIEFNQNILAEDKINDLKLKTEKLKYLKNKKILNTFGKTIFSIQSNYEINSNNVTYDKKKELIFSDEPSKIIDTFNNQIKVDEFYYDVIKKIIKANKMEIVDISKNKYLFENAIIDLNNKKIAGKDIEIRLDKGLFDPENDPRFKGRAIKISENNTEITKGVFTTCKIREDKCPPWHIQAEKVDHDKKNKLINYKNAWLKLYDMPILYFPKFFHPDPTVKRQSGFLMPQIIDSSSLGLSFKLPYYKVISDNKDLTFTSRIFSENEALFQNEYRQVNKNSKHIADFSIKEKNSSSKTPINAHICFAADKFDKL